MLVQFLPTPPPPPAPRLTALSVVGGRVRFALSKAASVGVRVVRLAGRRTLPAGAFTLQGRAGANSVLLQPHLPHRRALGAGVYRLTATPVGGQPRTVRLAVRARRAAR